MNEAFKIFVISTVIITLWTAFLLLQDKRGHKSLNRWFAGFLLALTLPQMDLYANLAVPGGFFMLALVASTFVWLKGPFMCVFIRVLTRKDTGVRSIGLHFVPWFCVLIAELMFPQIIMTCVLLGMCHMLGYMLFSVWQLTRVRDYLAELWFGFQNSAYYWLLYVIGGLIALVAVDLVVILLMLSGVLHNAALLEYFAFPGFSVYVLSVGILSVYRPELLFREKPDNAGPAADELDKEDLPSAPHEKEPSDQHEHKERYLERDGSLVQLLMQQLTQFMQEQSIYRQNELSLPDLAGYLGISVHQVSELLNVHAGASFYNYINGYRLDYACNLLADPNCHLRILDIAFEAGYNNKNTFYRVFKDKHGITPNQYRAQALSQASVVEG